MYCDGEEFPNALIPFYLLSLVGTPPITQPLPQKVQQQPPPVQVVAPTAPTSQTSQAGSNATAEDEKAEEAESMEVDQQQTSEKQEVRQVPRVITP